MAIQVVRPEQKPESAVTTAGPRLCLADILKLVLTSYATTNGEPISQAHLYLDFQDIYNTGITDIRQSVYPWKIKESVHRIDNERRVSPRYLGSWGSIGSTEDFAPKPKFSSFPPRFLASTPELEKLFRMTHKGAKILIPGKTEEQGSLKTKGRKIIKNNNNNILKRLGTS